MFLVTVFIFVHFEFIIVFLSNSGIKVMNGFNMHICVITACVNIDIYNLLLKVFPLW